MSLHGALAVTRFGLGARPGEIAEASADPKGWLKAQLKKDAPAGFRQGSLKSSKVLLNVALDYFGEVREEDAKESDRRAFLETVNETTIDEITARTTYAVSTDTPFHERLVRFWSNHFTVAAAKPMATIIAGAFEREAIRPNILGSFAQLAERAIFHPGMLVYLDNWISIGPDSRTGKATGRGLNENLAREVLELHTVTPASGYTQEDVRSFAEALTGWTIGNHLVESRRAGEAVFSGKLHEPGQQTVLGKRFNDSGASQAKLIVRDLCRSPHTARHISTKLARHFVSDDPPESLVEKLTDTFLSTRGDLRKLYLTLVDSEEAWAAEPMKFKTPDELLVSAGRLVGLSRVGGHDLAKFYRSLAQFPFDAPSPEGWPDIAEAWNGPDAIMKRVEWANRIAERNTLLDGRLMLRTGLGERATPRTVEAIEGAESRNQAIALALLSPDFQMR